MIPPLPELRFLPIPAASRSRYLGDRFSYMEAGAPDAPPLLLLHGVGANSMYWRFQLAGLSDRFRVVAWNTPGYMLSDNLVAETLTNQDYAGAVIDFMTAAGISTCGVLANSFGTRLAQCVAWLHPGRFSRLAFTGAVFGPRDLSEPALAAMVAARQAQVAPGGYGLGERADALVGPGTPEETLTLIRHVLRATNPDGYMRAARFLASNIPVAEFASHLTMPVLLIQGEADRVTPLEANAAVLARAVPHARLEVLAGVGHLPDVERWDAVNTLARAFFGAAGG